MRTAFLGFAVAPMAVYYVASAFHVSIGIIYFEDHGPIIIHSYIGTGLAN